MTSNDYRKCRDCDGAGEHTVSHYSGNPQLETARQCCECGGHGKIRVTPVDPITALAAARKLRLANPYSAQRYGEIRQRVVSPVFLP
jgi:hypothetical protein